MRAAVPSPRRLALIVAVLVVSVGQSGFGAQPSQGTLPIAAAGLRCIPLEHALNPPPSIPTTQDVRYIRRVQATEPPLRYAATVPDDIIDAGRVVDFTLTITNAGVGPVTLSFPTTQRLDVVIWNDDCTEMWRWSRGKAFAQVTEALRVPAGGAIVLHIPWDQRDQAGRPVRIGAYEARVVFLGRRTSRNAPLALSPLVFALR